MGRFQYIMLLLLVTSNGCFAQDKPSLSLNFTGNWGLLSNANSSIEYMFGRLHVTKHEGKVADKHGVWNHQEIGLNLTSRKKPLRFSAGLRFFNWRYTRDSVNNPYNQIIYYIPSQQESVGWYYEEHNNYAESKRVITTGLPYVSITYIKMLKPYFCWSSEFSIGYFGIIKRRLDKNTAYNPHLQFLWNERNTSRRDMNYKIDGNPYAIDIRLSVGIEKQFREHIGLNRENCRIGLGLSYYYAQDGVSFYHGLQLQGSIALQLKKIIDKE